MTNNQAASGGVVAVRGGGGSVALRFTYFTNNTATAKVAPSTEECRFGGGAVLFDYSNQTQPFVTHINDCVFASNVATGCGGAVLLNNIAGGSFSNNDLSHNEAAVGGAVYAVGVSGAKWHHTALTDNRVAGDGGGMYLRQCTHSLLQHHRRAQHCRRSRRRVLHLEQRGQD
jgi:hypothetical protein